MRSQLLEVARESLKNKNSYPGYPTERLVIDNETFKSSELLDLPDGPWNMNNTNLPTAEDTQRFIDAGYVVDSNGRPLHPLIKEMITNPEVGVVVGRGKYYQWGPNYTADPVVITNEAVRKVLLIRRGDTGNWALPGGFVDGNEDPYDSARRELKEEAGLDIESDGTLLYRGLVGDSRATAHAWPETSAYRFIVDEPFDVLGGDDATEARWWSEDALPEGLYGSHLELIKLALERDHDTTIEDIIHKPKDELEVTVIDAGHMAYDHLFVSDGQTRLFVKAHDASRFTDPFREAHSREYLDKENTIMNDLKDQEYFALPNRVALLDESTILAMDALHPDEGWLWEAPKEADAFDAYVTDVIDAFDVLQTKIEPVDAHYHKGIEDTYTTFWKEGWDDITDEKLELITDKIKELSANWKPSQKYVAAYLMLNLKNLKEKAAALERDVPLYMSHNDARQSNIAWRQGDGAKIVDWSWGDVAPKDADVTMFLIDLRKSGHNVFKYFDRMNQDQALVLIGFWLAHSLWQTRDGSTTVREHQVAAACAAYELIH